jgi:hypothetical protein
VTNSPVFALRCDPLVLPPLIRSERVVDGRCVAFCSVTNCPDFALLWRTPPVADFFISSSLAGVAGRGTVSTAIGGAVINLGSCNSLETVVEFTEVMLVHSGRHVGTAAFVNLVVAVCLCISVSVVAGHFLPLSVGTLDADSVICHSVSRKKHRSSHR